MPRILNFSLSFSVDFGGKRSSDSQLDLPLGRWIVHMLMCFGMFLCIEVLITGARNEE